MPDELLNAAFSRQIFIRLIGIGQRVRDFKVLMTYCLKDEISAVENFVEKSEIALFERCNYEKRASCLIILYF